MVDRLLDILADKLTERLSAGHKELYTAKELAERYGVSSVIDFSLLDLS